MNNIKPVHLAQVWEALVQFTARNSGFKVIPGYLAIASVPSSYLDGDNVLVSMFFGCGPNGWRLGVDPLCKLTEIAREGVKVLSL